ncbi:glycosyltransferase family 2 protein [Thioalkalivibrio sp. AKL19]|uniref:glycosyltransferase family 2 protein n=1 Tax=Thioalkalivibrio sp. AKL19 TaxID=1266914 RepID=UPI0018CB5456|nr:hypothetical protein [Thioalkalivibrio sp. AKL19]
MDVSGGSRSLVVLTWKAPRTLARTLDTLAPLFPMFTERLVVCQEAQPEEMKIASRAGFQAVPLSENLGIQGGLKAAVQAATTQRVLLLENDCGFVGGAGIVADVLDRADQLMALSDVRFVKMQAMPDPPRRRFFRNWRFRNGQLNRRFAAFLRPENADGVLSEAVVFPRPDLLAPRAIEAVGDGLFLTDSRFAVWSNRANYLAKNFFLNELLPFAEANPTRRHCNGLPELEHRINAPFRRWWWRRNRFPLLVAHPGFFDHTRVDRPVGDSKWLDGGPVATLRTTPPDTDRGGPCAS